MLTVLTVLLLFASTEACRDSITTVSGSLRPKDICSGRLIFEEEFDKFDQKVWKHEETLSGMGNRE
jgi:hypothetical protein